MGRTRTGGIMESLIHRIPYAKQSSIPLPILADSREQRPFVFAGYPAMVTVTSLEAGDYSLAGFERRVAVERKELQDLVGCLSGERERFARELARLRGYDAAAVVVEAPADDLRSGRYRSKLDAGAAWQGVLAFTQRFRVPFLFCADRAEAEAATFDFLRHYARDRWRELQALSPAKNQKQQHSGQQVAERCHDTHE